MEMTKAIEAREAVNRQNGYDLSINRGLANRKANCISSFSRLNAHGELQGGRSSHSARANIGRLMNLLKDGLKKTS